MRAILDAVLPTLRPQQQAPLRVIAKQQTAREDAFVAAHIARRVPVLAREYAQHRKEVGQALVAAALAIAALADADREEAVIAALMAGDFAEAGHLLAHRIDALLHTQAEDAAELEAQQILDTEEL